MLSGICYYDNQLYIYGGADHRGDVANLWKLKLGKSTKFKKIHVNHSIFLF